MRRLLATEAADQGSISLTPGGDHGRVRTTSDPSAADLVPARESAEICAVTRSFNGVLRSCSPSPSPSPEPSHNPSPCPGPSRECEDYPLASSQPNQRRAIEREAELPAGDPEEERSLAMALVATPAANGAKSKQQQL